MTERPLRRRRLPLLLFSALLVLLVIGTVVTAQLYRSSLRSGVEQMRASVTAAQREQQRLMARVRAAEATLAERAAGLATAAGAAPAPTSEPPVADAGQPRAGQSALRRSLPAAERARLAARLGVLAREAARLPPGRAPLPRRTAGAPGKQLLRGQLAVAAAAAAADDVALLDAALFGAQCLADAPYRSPDRHGRAMAAELAVLREGLRTRAVAPPAAPPAAWSPSTASPVR